MVTLYEEMRDWEKAALDATQAPGQAGRRATAGGCRPTTSPNCGKEHMVSPAAWKTRPARLTLARPLGCTRNCLDAYLHLGDLELARGPGAASALEPVAQGGQAGPAARPPGGQPGELEAEEKHGEAKRPLPPSIDRVRPASTAEVHHPLCPWPSATSQRDENDQKALDLLDRAISQAGRVTCSTPTACAARSSCPRAATEDGPWPPTATCWLTRCEARLGHATSVSQCGFMAHQPHLEVPPLSPLGLHDPPHPERAKGARGLAEGD